MNDDLKKFILISKTVWILMVLAVIFIISFLVAIFVGKDEAINVGSYMSTGAVISIIAFWVGILLADKVLD